jgi:hypothetical protein
MQTGKLENNSLVTPEEEAAWSTMSAQEKHERGFVNYSAYVVDRRQNDLSGEGNHRASFVQGLNEVLDLARQKPNEIVSLLRAKMGGMQGTRVVPFDTMTFTSAIRDFHESLRNGDGNGEASLHDLVGTTMRSFEDDGFELTGGAPATILANMRRDFEGRDTPIFHFNPADNTLTSHGEVIGYHTGWEDPENLIGGNVKWLSSLDPEAILADLGL